jgi:large subunit ribosomal protein L19
MNVASLIKVKINPQIPDIAPGDTVRVSIKVIEGGKERLQPFQGVVIKLQRGGIGASFTVRRIAYGIGVERTFPIYSPRVEKVEIIRHGKVRRAKLYYLRGRSGKAARIKERRVDRKKKLAQAQIEPETAQEEIVQEEPEAVQTQEELVREEAQAEEAQEGPEAEKAQEEPKMTQATDEAVPEEPEAAQAQDELVREEAQAEEAQEGPEAEKVQEEPKMTQATDEAVPEESEAAQAQDELIQEESEATQEQEESEDKSE